MQDGAKLWAIMEPYFVPPGREGRRDYDHAEAVAHLKRESRNIARDKKMPDPLENLNTSALIPHLIKVLKSIGLVVKNGKVVGTLKDLEEDDVFATPATANDDADESEDIRMAA